MENAPLGLAQKRLAAASALSRTRAGQLCRRLKNSFRPAAVCRSQTSSRETAEAIHDHPGIRPAYLRDDNKVGITFR